MIKIEDLPAHIREKNKHRLGAPLINAKVRKTEQLVNEVQNAQKQPLQRRNKFGAKRTTVNGTTYDSKREAEICEQLKLLEKAGHIIHLDFQVRYRIEVNGIHICDYTVDAQYITVGPGPDKGWHYVDVKSPATAAKRDFKRNRKLMKAVHDIDIEVVY